MGHELNATNMPRILFAPDLVVNKVYVCCYRFLF